jgi:hypothetical protein
MFIKYTYCDKDLSDVYNIVYMIKTSITCLQHGLYVHDMITYQPHEEHDLAR